MTPIDADDRQSYFTLMSHAVDPHSILSRYPADCQPIAIEPLVNSGGFSGALLWRVTAPRGSLVLRRWPQEYPSPERLAWIHRLLAYARQNGFDRLPVPVARQRGETFAAVDDWLWELSHWIAGVADYPSDPRPEKLAAAAQALAEFHLVTQDFGPPLDRQFSDAFGHPSIPAVIQRLHKFQALARDEFSQLERALHSPNCDWPELRRPGQQHLVKFAAHADQATQQLQAFDSKTLVLQPCIRDIWHEHLLFESDRLTGIIDFGSARIDSVATDLARLLGSLAGDDADAWSRGLAAYRSIRLLSDDELSLVSALDRANILLSGINWLQWIFVERRTFPNRAAVLARFHSIAARR